MIKYILFIFFSLSITTISAQHLYNFYRGNLHAHTAYSDGNKEEDTDFDTPYESFQFAKDALNFDFLGISEHNHAGAGMSLARYTEGLAEADSAMGDDFVALYGMEWGTISGGGHVLVYGFDSLIGWEAGNYHIFNAKTDYNGLFEKVAAKEGAFAYLAHPEKDDYDSIFHKPYSAVNDDAIIGLATRSGPAFSTDTTYSDASGSSYNARYKDALGLGYHMAVGLDHDNHYTTFGKMSPGRLVVLAPSLSKDNILLALRSRRFYSSDDWNTEVYFTLNDKYYMGDIVSDTTNPSFSIQIYDPDPADTIRYIRLKHGVPGSGSNPTSAATSNYDTSLTFTDNIAHRDIFYYYLEIRQEDGDMIYTAPIWFTKDTALLLPVEWLDLSLNKKENGTIDVNWEVRETGSIRNFKVQRSEGSDFSTIDEVPANPGKTRYRSADTDPLYGNLYYRINAEKANNLHVYSEVLSINNHKLPGYPEVHFISLNELMVSFNSDDNSNVKIAVYNVIGENVIQTNLSASEGSNEKQLDISALPGGVYILKIMASDRQFHPVRFVKY